MVNTHCLKDSTVPIVNVKSNDAYYLLAKYVKGASLALVALRKLHFRRYHLLLDFARIVGLSIYTSFPK